MISEINILLKTLKSHDLVGRRANISLKPYKDILQNRMGLCILYLGYGSKKIVQNNDDSS